MFSDGVLTMLMSKLKAVVGALMVAVCLIGIGTAFVLGRQPDSPDKAAPVPKRADTNEAAIRAMQDRFQGTWKCVAVHMGGVKTKADLTLTITGNSWESMLDGRAYQSGTFKLVDLGASPKQIDWVITADTLEDNNKNTTDHGIFMIDGDSLICANSDVATYPRPEVFFSAPTDGCYAGMYMRVPKK
jgi:uncharacterized protein (TIGR03067 family)